MNEKCNVVWHLITFRYHFLYKYCAPHGYEIIEKLLYTFSLLNKITTSEIASKSLRRILRPLYKIIHKKFQNGHSDSLNNNINRIWLIWLSHKLVRSVRRQNMSRSKLNLYTQTSNFYSKRCYEAVGFDFYLRLLVLNFKICTIWTDFYRYTS